MWEAFFETVGFPHLWKTWVKQCTIPFWTVFSTAAFHQHFNYCLCALQHNIELMRISFQLLFCSYFTYHSNLLIYVWASETLFWSLYPISLYQTHSDAKGGGRPSIRSVRGVVPTADENPHIGNYRLLKTIGKGNFAKVKLARHVLTSKEVTRSPVYSGSS